MNEPGNVDSDMGSVDLEQDDGNDGDKVSDEDDKSAVADSQNNSAGSGEEGEKGKLAGKFHTAHISNNDGKFTCSL